MNYSSYPTRTIIYSPELSREFGAVTASILYQQLNYWFSKKKQFFKYLAPPAEPDIDKTPHYKTGDSWTEELGFSIHEFRSAFDKMGIRYNSLAKYKKAKDNNTVFNKDGKQYLFASFIDKRNNLTYYVKNWDYDKEFQQRVFGIDVDKLPSDEVIEDTKRKSAGNAKTTLSRGKNTFVRDVEKINLPDPLDDREEKNKYKEQNEEISSLDKIPEIKKETENPSVGEIKQAPPAPASCQGAKSGLSNVLHRPKHTFKGTAISVSSDAWMVGQNPNRDFVNWLLQEKIKENPNSDYNKLPNIVAEIKNDCYRADGYWVAYQNFLQGKN
jgi:hypothetical protein